MTGRGVLFLPKYVFFVKFTVSKGLAGGINDFTNKKFMVLIFYLKFAVAWSKRRFEPAIIKRRSIVNLDKKEGWFL